MDTIKVKLKRSLIGKPETHRKIIKAIGLRKIGQVVEKNDTPQIRGMIHKVDYMVEIVD